LVFDGQEDALILPRHPLAGAARFTAEAVFRPMAGRLPSAGCICLPTTPRSSAGRDADPVRNPRGRHLVVSRHLREGPGYAQVLVDPARLHPLGRWYHVAQTFDGTTYRSYVDGVLEGEARVAFTPQGQGSSSLAMRRNRVDHFHGALRVAASPPALPPRIPAPRQALREGKEKALPLPAGLATVVAGATGRAACAAAGKLSFAYVPLALPAVFRRCLDALAGLRRARPRGPGQSG
jgi:hypothetical protein